MINGYNRALYNTQKYPDKFTKKHTLILFAGFGRISAASGKKEVIEIYIFLSMM
jgi:hypothetical protein